MATYRKEFNKLICRQRLTSIGLYDLEGDIDEAIKELKKIKERYLGVMNIKENEGYIDNINPKDVKFDNLKLDLQDVRYDDRQEYVLYGERLATESEVAAYNLKEEQQKQKVENTRRQEYEKLKAEFEKKQ